MTSISSYSSTTTRVTGLVSGLDVDSIVESLMDAEEVPLNKLEQKKQLAEWKQDAYRQVSTSLKTFADEYFNYSNSSSNMLSQSTYDQYTLTSSDDSVVRISTTSSSQAGSHTVLVNNLATAAAYQSSAVTEGISADSAADFTQAAGNAFLLTIDGREYTVDLDENITDLAGLQEAVDEAVGSGKIAISDTNGDGTGYLTMEKAAGSGIGMITVSAGESGGALEALGFSGSGNLTNYLDTSETLADIGNQLGFSFDSNGNIGLTINEVDFEFSSSMTLDEMMEEINDSEAGVTMSYSSTNDSFLLTANQTGAGKTLDISETGSTFLQNVGLNDYTAGEDAAATIDGVKYTRSENSFTVDGLIYSLKAESTETQRVSLTQDTEAILAKITSFVADYNTLIDSLNSTISEEYDRDYTPLTDAQKEEMSEDEIETWEEKAKTGILQNDAALTSLLQNLRTALYESVAGVSTHLTEIGITTSSNYADKGKLVIDTDALKEAIATNPEEVASLFAQQSAAYGGTTTVVNLTSEQRQVRSSEEGLAYRVYDILQDNISTYTGIDGHKGILLEKAGQEGDGSEYDNTLTSQISSYDDEIEEMLAKLADKEDYYYEKYSAMETFINQMNNQIDSLLSYLE
ncbi:flagellar filament capping protein FliD [Desulfosporosinus hippei]|uniref:Flagellar hook-associated protein 2 n=1 Tax=Desulfosporosinus hippei DSM 8344 TaxID=1121419 RepID=A0A1G8CZT9_9FIRM|nr:flagellar filament capping protein FliD [Desulfosporosinus hippei]SDH50649.1 flagellar hook-associated protein 2 [Desulfosporosinus hippei DSM 8344]